MVTEVALEKDEALSVALIGDWREMGAEAISLITVGEWAPSEKQPLSELYRRFIDGLGDAVTDQPRFDATMGKPLDLSCRPPLPRGVRLYVFNCTDHPSERKAGDYRIQLRLPGQQKRERGCLALEPRFLVVLAGYVVEFDVFVLWDANAHSEFPYSKGVQVSAGTVHRAAIYGQSEQSRDVRRAGGYAERVLAVRADHLLAGLQRRQELTRLSLLGGRATSPSTAK